MASACPELHARLNSKAQSKKEGSTTKKSGKKGSRLVCSVPVLKHQMQHHRYPANDERYGDEAEMTQLLLFAFACIAHAMEAI